MGNFEYMKVHKNMIITANMATIPQRIKTAKTVIESIYDQVDLVRLYLNNFEEIPQEFMDDKIKIDSGDDLCSSGKVYWAKIPNQYYFCIDDDILYPSNYVSHTLERLKYYNEDVIVSYHGRSFPRDKKIENYFKDHIEHVHFKDDSPYDVEVDVMGNGVSCWNTNNIKIDINKFTYLYMDDILVSKQAHEQNKKRITLAHKVGFLKKLEIYYDTALSAKYINNNQTQTEMCNSINW